MTYIFCLLQNAMISTAIPPIKFVMCETMLTAKYTLVNTSPYCENSLQSGKHIESLCARPNCLPQSMERVSSLQSINPSDIVELGRDVLQVVI